MARCYILRSSTPKSLITLVMLLLLNASTSGSVAQGPKDAVAVPEPHEPIPHVDDCNFCHSCLPSHTNHPSPPSSPSNPPPPANTPTVDHSPAPGATLPALTALAPEDHALALRFINRPHLPPHPLVSQRPNCSSCQGCSTQLLPVAHNASFLGHAITHETGASSASVFRASRAQAHTGPGAAAAAATAIVKLLCPLLPPGSESKQPPLEARCPPVHLIRKMRLLLALDKLSEECGFRGIAPKVWVDEVDAVMPGVGSRISSLAMWQDVAAGVSLERLVFGVLPPREVLDLLHNRLNRSQVVLAAIFDLLTSQCDRHAQNIFIAEDGRLQLIDNELALRTAGLTGWRGGGPRVSRALAHCAVDSVLLPTTQKNMILRAGFPYVMKRKRAQRLHVWPRAHPGLLLDYRCYVPGSGELGTSYPPQVRHCLEHIANKSVPEVQRHYGFLDRSTAENLWTRATDMITHGFEHALTLGQPLNPSAKRYRLAPKCCGMVWDGVGRHYRCQHPWDPSQELPVGDPLTGGAWEHDWPDIGTYEGGT